MSDKALVSVIIPVYNIESHLLIRCIESVAAQTYEPIEIIVVDDGSTDGSGKVCDETAARLNSDNGSRRREIKVIHKENSGSSGARNAGLKAACGEYIGFVDSDDYVDPDFVSSMMSAIDRYGVSMAQISRDEIAEDGSRLPDVCIPPDREYLISATEQMRELLLHRGDCSFCTRLTKRELFNGREFPEGKLNEDFYLLVQMLSEVGEYVILPTQAYHVYYRSGSNSRSGDREVFRQVFADIVDNADHAERIVKEQYPSLITEAKRFALYQRLDYLLHVPVSMMRSDNSFYGSVIRYIRGNIGAVLFNRYLTLKNRVYLMLFAVAPKTIRVIHKKIKRFDA